ncbi:formate/nitrite transporter family protein [Staphylococcus simulans]|uniref:formate/nitrite transporter family protein n=1 Tax=Staphylococcus simulans TaxID=1286 RepID=UPI000E677658|nr:formate/nitrite transporter family protein [Staphylococcus simulans]RIN78319.1 formate/nitrite transporter [Staphylococcus simulans]
MNSEKYIRWDNVFYGRKWVKEVVKTIQTKDVLQATYFKRYLLRAMMAGFIISIIAVFVLAIKAGFVQEVHTGEINTGIINIVGSVAFSFALVLILFTNSELLTSNFMYFTVGLYYKVISPWRAFQIFMLCFIGNMLGALAFFIILRFSDVVTPEMMKQLEVLLHHKTMTADFTQILAKAIFANFFINISLVIAMQIEDILAKMFVMMFGVAIFAFMGYEHVVYNACLFIGGAIYQSDVLHFWPAVLNIIAAFIGNYIGGGLIIGLFYAYLNDHKQFKNEL